MAHNLARRLDGTYMAIYVDKPAWHGLGDVVDKLQSAEQIYTKVFGRRVITLVPAYAKLGKKIVEVPEFRALADVKAGTVFAFSSPEYVPIQDLNALRILEALVKSSKKGVFGSAGALNANASRGFASIDLTRVLGKDALAIKGDPSAMEAWLFGTWAHDATGSLNIGRWRNRVDCNNMLNAATADATAKGRLVRIVHTGADSMADRLHEAERILGLVEDDFRANAALLNTLNQIRIPKFPTWLRGFTEQLVPIPDEMERKTLREEARQLIAEITLNSKTMVGVPADTAYRAYQGAIEYADHYRPLRVSAENAKIVPEKRFRSITEGPAAEFKERALDLIRQEFEVPVLVKAR